MDQQKVYIVIDIKGDVYGAFSTLIKSQSVADKINESWAKHGIDDNRVNILQLVMDQDKTGFCYQRYSN